MHDTFSIFVVGASIIYTLIHSIRCKTVISETVFIPKLNREFQLESEVSRLMQENARLAQENAKREYR